MGYAAICFACFEIYTIMFCWDVFYPHEVQNFHIWALHDSYQVLFPFCHRKYKTNVSGFQIKGISGELVHQIAEWTEQPNICVYLWTIIVYTKKTIFNECIVSFTYSVSYVILFSLNILTFKYSFRYLWLQSTILIYVLFNFMFVYFKDYFREE